MEALQRQAPLIMHGQREANPRTPDLALANQEQRPSGPGTTEVMVPLTAPSRLEDSMQVLQSPTGVGFHSGPMSTPGLLPPGMSHGYPDLGQWQEEQARRQWQLNSEVRQVAQMLKQLQEENLFLRVQLMEERENRYSTPPEEVQKPLEVPRHVSERRKVLEDEKIKVKRKEAAPSKEADQEKKAAPAPTKVTTPDAKVPKEAKTEVKKAAPSTPKKDAQSK